MRPIFSLFPDQVGFSGVSRLPVSSLYRKRQRLLPRLSSKIMVDYAVLALCLSIFRGFFLYKIIVMPIGQKKDLVQSGW